MGILAIFSTFAVPISFLALRGVRLKSWSRSSMDRIEVS